MNELKRSKQARKRRLAWERRVGEGKQRGGKSEVKIWEVEKWGKRNRRRNRDRKRERQKDM